MKAIRIRIVASLAATLIGYVPVQLAYSYLTGFQDPLQMLMYPESLNLSFHIVVVGVWAIVLSMLYKNTMSELQKRLGKGREVDELEARKRSVENLKGVAEVEFMKRRISEQTFNEIERMCEKQLVEIKARTRGLSGKQKRKEPAEGAEETKSA
jgi:hypothetical protein